MRILQNTHKKMNKNHAVLLLAWRDDGGWIRDKEMNRGTRGCDATLKRKKGGHDTLALIEPERDNHTHTAAAATAPPMAAITAPPPPPPASTSCRLPRRGGPLTRIAAASSSPSSRFRPSSTRRPSSSTSFSAAGSSGGGGEILHVSPPSPPANPDRKSVV